MHVDDANVTNLAFDNTIQIGELFGFSAQETIEKKIQLCGAQISLICQSDIRKEL